MKVSRLVALAGMVGCIAAAPALAGVTPPQVTASELAQPLPKPYDASANASADIDAALARAKVSGKRVLIDLGGNWCPDCRVLAGVAAIPEVKSYLDANFEVVFVDVGHFDKNMNVPARFGAPMPAGVPTVLVVTPDGTLVNGKQREDLDNDRSMTPQSIVDWLAQWTKTPG